MAARLTAYLVVGIVAATLIAGLIVGAQRDDSDGPVDLIVHNARVYTADADRSMAEAVAVRGNQILRVGSNREINRLRRPQTIVIDAEGAAVLPGFNDAHLHLVDGGLMLQRIDLGSAATLDDVKQRIRTWADANPAPRWVLGRGWRPEALVDAPARQLLDSIVPDRPVEVIADGEPVTWVNTRALELAGITSRTPNPAHGVIEKDARTGQPTGVLKGTATDLVGGIIPRPTQEERARALRIAIAEAHRRGITSVQNAGGTADELELFDEARRAGDLKVRVYAALSLPAGPLSPDVVAALEEIADNYPDDPLLKTGAVKIRIDGDVDTHSAALLDAGTGEASETATSLTADELNDTVRILDANGWQVMTHAIGDRAVRMALDAFEYAARSNRTPSQARRHRIEHVDMTTEADLARFAKLGAIASMQPQDDVEDAGDEAWTGYFGGDLANRMWAYRSIAAAGGRLAFGSNWPDSHLDPLAGLQAAVNGIASDGAPESTAPSPDRVSVKAAIDAYTAGAAYASFDEQRKGSITRGMLADLVVLSDDIFAAPPAALTSATVAVTIFDGKIVYRRGETFTN
jgi:predicted amidohydrolase YtcJ